MDATLVLIDSDGELTRARALVDQLWNSSDPARALLRWSAVDLARESSVGVNTIRRAEAAENGTSLTAANELAIIRALEAAGAEFIDENGGGPGVRFRKRQRAKQFK